MSSLPSIFVSGASGFIAKHVILTLLNRGYPVTGSVRTLTRAGEVRAAVEPHLNDPSNLEERLQFAALDLGEDQWWPEALVGSQVLIHTASPFPMHQPKNEDDIIRPAVDGTLRALRAAKDAGITRVVLTSSVVAILSAAQSEGRPAFSENDWADVSDPAMTPYAKSKTMAERAAWDFVQDHPEMRLTVINPGLVTGPPLDLSYGTSIGVIERVLKGRDPMLPRVGFPVVDVRDVAEMHVRALEQDATIGERFIASERFLWYHEIAEILKEAHPDLGITTRIAPNILVRLLSMFDPAVRSILPILGKRQEVSSAKARSDMGLRFIEAAQSIRDTAAFLRDHDKV